MRELLALAIDRATTAEVSRLNREVGRSVYYRDWGRGRFNRVRQGDRILTDWQAAYAEEQSRINAGQDAVYEKMLLEYVELKMYLHGLRKTTYHPWDEIYDHSPEDFKRVLDRCDELKQQIRAKRKTISFAAWGDLNPEQRTPYDKPLLYAFDEYTCSFIVNADTIASEDEEPTVTCPLKGEHWFHGQPFCRTHLGETRRREKVARRAARHLRGRQLANCRDGCPIHGAHCHTWSGTEHF
jgi:hypothetical protein